MIYVIPFENQIGGYETYDFVVYKQGKIVALLNVKASSNISLLLNLVEREGLLFNKEMMKKSESMLKNMK